MRAAIAGIAIAISFIMLANTEVKPQEASEQRASAHRQPSLDEIIRDTAEAWELDETLLRAIVAVESSGGKQVQGQVESHYLSRCRKAVAKRLGREKSKHTEDRLSHQVEMCARSLGPAQVMGHYALSLGVSLEEAVRPETNLELAAHKLYSCQRRFSGDKAILCYNGLKGDGSYVRKVKRAMKEKHERSRAI